MAVRSALRAELARAFAQVGEVVADVVADALEPETATSRAKRLPREATPIAASDVERARASVLRLKARKTGAK